MAIGSRGASQAVLPIQPSGGTYLQRVRGEGNHDPASQWARPSGCKGRPALPPHQVGAATDRPAPLLPRSRSDSDSGGCAAGGELTRRPRPPSTSWGSRGRGGACRGLGVGAGWQVSEKPQGWSTTARHRATQEGITCPAKPCKEPSASPAGASGILRGGGRGSQRQGGHGLRRASGGSAHGRGVGVSVHREQGGVWLRQGGWQREQVRQGKGTADEQLGSSGAVGWQPTH